MKKIFFMLVAAAVFTACSNEKKSDSGSTDKDTASSVTLPYTASYSSSFEMGKPEHVVSILNGSWKDWENNKLENMRSWVADTIVAFQSDNRMITGVDSLQASWTRSRARYTSVIDTIDAVMPVYSKDKKENWVLVWATEINTLTDGTKDTVSLMETWRINKDGKADMLFQFDRNQRKQ